jgi:hypothetical protein
MKGTALKSIRPILLALLATITLVSQARAVGYWGRMYDPNLQRWIQRDPIGERGGLNLYRFAANSPVNFIDPFGAAERMIGFTKDLSTGAITTQSIQHNSFQDFGIGLHGPLPETPMGAASRKINQGWDWMLDQVTPPLDPIQNPYAYAVSQTARQVSLNLFLIALSSRSCPGTPVAGAAEETAALKPYGGPGGGHHLPAKSAFEGAVGYDLNQALAIPNAELARLGINHGLVSGAQQTLYRAFAQTGAPLTWEAAAGIETQALIRGGMNPGMAQATVAKAIEALKGAGVPGPTRIPWGK